ncbi:DEAD/DEAH box helicase [Paenirhodobacter hankyongi]|uniref:DEAD/DEAH box helicase n=1 Tax=Paenirhodobacter hankyongi TaxID=2294033 RepID=A0A421BME0_9RHOB|nr:DEAD/DEAH box helicase [Sinirhodobacter hankyongi]RLL64214.1 DEAD/DEAH box helicase [Sinirhodobacter hankyongi]
METFENLGLAPILLQNLAGLGLVKPTPIQEQGIPHIVRGRDLLGIAQTGTGKTAAFGLPMLTRIIAYGKRPAPKTVRALVLAPTRELATQIHDNLSAFAAGAPVRIQRVVGGASINVQSEKLAKGTDVLIATPGRLLDLLERRALVLSETKYLVLDEADQMLDIGFIHALRRIARLIPEDRQTMLFSATMPKLMEELAQSYLQDPVRVEVAPPGKAAEKIEQGVHFTTQGEKAALLAEYVAKHPGELAVVFNRTKHGSDKLATLMDKWGFSVAAIHGNKSQNARERALSAFRAGEVKLLIATDVAARGLDIPEVAHVYNYDLPNVPENYVHRIGRTARAGRNGRAVAFCGPMEMDELRAIEKAMGARIPVIGGEPHIAVAAPTPTRPGGNKKPHRGRGPKPAQGGAPKANPARANPAKASAGGAARPRRRTQGSKGGAAA